ncbi:Rrf2 family transcriptional regulator [Komagataeibacter melaceti]|uniref:Rrf2 family transcriptional regulator n=1 Tax=Komagataeibacter melaceti TaxID=2766577 RepID=A0A371YXL3_9PROT|nr:Rrf2 family transcriptional regulator [Komagataeibacter melaceti]
MRLTLHTDFALRVLIYLGQNPDRRVSIHEIAEVYGISHNHLIKVVNHLSHGGVVHARRGRSGGLELAAGPRDIIIGDIVRRMETDMRPIASCEPANGRPCLLAGNCPLRGLLGRAVEAFLTVLDNTTLHDIIPTDRIGPDMEPGGVLMAHAPLPTAPACVEMLAPLPVKVGSG